MPKSSNQPPSNTNRIGCYGEDIAVSYLLAHRFRIVERNFRVRFGEIDVIAYEGDTLVFVEVKTRTSDSYGSPLQSIRRTKLAEIVKTGRYYQLNKRVSPHAIRIDVIGIMVDPIDQRVVSLEHVRNVTAGMVRL